MKKMKYHLENEMRVRINDQVNEAVKRR